MSSRAILHRVGLATLTCALAAPAFAHTGHPEGSGFGAGFLHPLLGADHLAAMVAVGLWAAFLGGRAVLALPLAFPAAMAAGAGLGAAGLAVPALETGIAASVLVIGLCTALALRAPVWLASGAVGVFALFHGAAHGAEMPAGAHWASYAAGFLLATAMLHAAGLGLGLLGRNPAGKIAARATAGLIAIAGASFLAGAI
ncbi:HupE/UreJ family protein [Rhodobacteraceae bacterium DSL-40]|uniref:HupE/UreJ family protein n=1 Tax=Amaricoccus sp. B4 TaxID=3368557 RepID=UPI000DAC6E3D